MNQQPRLPWKESHLCIQHISPITVRQISPFAWVFSVKEALSPFPALLSFIQPRHPSFQEPLPDPPAVGSLPLRHSTDHAALEFSSHSPTRLGGFPGGSDANLSACNAGDLGLIPGSGRSPGEGNGNPLQNFCLENSMDGGAWWAIVQGVAKSWT